MIFACVYAYSTQEQLQRWTEHSTLIFENLKPVEKSKNEKTVQVQFLSLTLLILKINTTFEDVQMMPK